MDSPFDAWTETIGDVIDVDVMMEWAAEVEETSLGSLRWPIAPPSV
jgi:hypothetical protein